MALAARALAPRLAVPVDPDPLEILELARLVLAPRALRVEVLDAQKERGAARAREAPGQERGAKVSKMQRARRAGREAPGSSAHGRSIACGSRRPDRLESRAMPG